MEVSMEDSLVIAISIFQCILHESGMPTTGNKHVTVFTAPSATAITFATAPVPVLFCFILFEIRFGGIRPFVNAHAEGL